MQGGLSLTADCQQCWRGLLPRVIQLFVFQENLEGRKSQKIRQGRRAASDGVAARNPARPPRIKVYKTFIDTYLYSSK